MNGKKGQTMSCGYFSKFLSKQFFYVGEHKKTSMEKLIVPSDDDVSILIKHFALDETIT